MMKTQTCSYIRDLTVLIVQQKIVQQLKCSYCIEDTGRIGTLYICWLVKWICSKFEVLDFVTVHNCDTSKPSAQIGFL